MYKITAWYTKHPNNSYFLNAMKNHVKEIEGHIMRTGESVCGIDITQLRQ